MSLDTESTERTLYLVWNCCRDTFMLNVKDDIPARATTKRELFSFSLSLQSVGFLGHRETGTENTFSRNLPSKAQLGRPTSRQHRRHLGEVGQITTSAQEAGNSRCLQPSKMPDCPTELHIFADASECAHVAVALTQSLSRS